MMIFLTSSNHNQPTQDCCIVIIHYNSTQKEHIRGNKYILIVDDYDSNVIFEEPLKIRNAGEIKKDWMHIHETLANKGSKPIIYNLDNEASNKFKKYNVQYQPAHPHIHCQNCN